MSHIVTQLAADAALPKGEKAVLKALADRAHPDGTRAFPGVSRLARETSYSERHVKRMLRSLERIRVIRALAYVKGGRRKATEYAIDLTMLQVLSTLKKGDIDDTKRVTSTPKKNDMAPPQRPESSFGTSWSAQIAPGELLREELLDGSQQKRADKMLRALSIEKDLRNTLRSSDPRGEHLENGIYRKRLDATYYDCVQAGVQEAEAIREVCLQCALILTSNRAVEMRGVDWKELGEHASSRISPKAQLFTEISSFERRRQIIVQAAIRVVVDIVLELGLWKPIAEKKAVPA